MKMASSVSLALALALGMGGLAASNPAMAAKKEKEAKPGTPKLSDPFRKAIGAVQAAVKAGDVAAIQSSLAVAEPLATMPDEKYYVGVMRFELSKLNKDKPTMRKAITDMYLANSPLATNMPELAYNAGALAYEAGDYADVVIKMADADRLGSKDINRFLLAAEANFKQNKTQAGLALVEKAINERVAAGQKPSEDWLRRALSVALKAKLGPETAKWSRELVKHSPNPTNWRDALVIYRDSTKMDGQMQLDLYRLMREAKALAGERDFFEYAEVATTRALPGEAKSVIDEGYATGAAAKSSRAIAEMYTLASGKIAADRASVGADEKKAGSAPDGKLAANTGNAFLAYGDNAKAIELLRLALKKGGVDADAVNTRLGIALLRSGMKAEAKQAFASVGGARAPIASFWSLWADQQP